MNYYISSMLVGDEGQLTTSLLDLLPVTNRAAEWVLQPVIRGVLDSGLQP